MYKNHTYLYFCAMEYDFEYQNWQDYISNVDTYPLFKWTKMISVQTLSKIQNDIFWTNVLYLFELCSSEIISTYGRT